MGQPFVPYRLHENLGQQAVNNKAKQTTMSVWLFCRGDIISVYYSVKGNRDCGSAFLVRELKSNFSLLTRSFVPSSASIKCALLFSVQSFNNAWKNMALFTLLLLLLLIFSHWKPNIYRMFNLKVDRQLSREYFTPAAV
jgi:hypothetical protein